MSIPAARDYVKQLTSLNGDQKKYLRKLINTGSVVPEAIIDASYEDLLDIINDMPSTTSNQGNNIIT